MKSCLVFSIEEFSVFDGPGIRTTVFLAGCPLRCEWCHNPEGQSFTNSIIRTANGCIECGKCLQTSKLVNGKRIFTDASVENCPKNLLRYVSKLYTSEELCNHLSKNFAILNASNGGVTFSGGEPLSNADFLIECFSLLKGKVNRGVQTSGYANPTDFDRVLAECDYMLFDLKIADENIHKKYTGVSNRRILRNFEALTRSGKSFTVRMPMIPTVTDTKENVLGIIDILLKNDVKYIELLPYNKFAGAKYSLVQREYAVSFNEQTMPHMRFEIFSKYGITAVKI